MKVKSQDYASGDDPFLNFRASELFGVDPVLGILLRVLDKLQRVRTFAVTGNLSVKTEPVDDAIEDVINYMILIKGLSKEEKPAPPEEVKLTYYKVVDGHRCGIDCAWACPVQEKKGTVYTSKS